MEAVTAFAKTLTRRFRVAKEARRGRRFYMCHTAHEHDRIYAENLRVYLTGMGVRCEILEFGMPGQNPELRQCLEGDAFGIIGLNSQLDHCWIGDENFVELAAKANAPVIHWLLDHPSSRWPEFTHSTAENSRFLLMSDFSERYFRRYCLADARTAWVAGQGPNERSSIDRLSRRSFLERSVSCLIPLNLRRVGGTVDDAQARLQSLEAGLAEAVKEAIELARLDLDGPLDAHLAATLARRRLALANSQFHFCFQIVEETVQVWRRLRIFEIASRFPVVIQTDIVPENLRSDVAASFCDDPAVNSMANTITRMKSCRAICSANFASDMLHDRTQNGLNAGCVVLVEDTPTHRRLFTHGKNALLFRYDDDSLAQCLDLVCNRPEHTYQIARAGFRKRRDRAIRFGGFENILELAWQ